MLDMYPGAQNPKRAWVPAGLGGEFHDLCILDTALLLDQPAGDQDVAAIRNVEGARPPRVSESSVRDRGFLATRFEFMGDVRVAEDGTPDRHADAVSAEIGI